MVRDYVETLTDRDLSDATIVVEPGLGGLEAKVAHVRKQIDQAKRGEPPGRRSVAGFCR